MAFNEKEKRNDSDLKEEVEHVSPRASNASSLSENGGLVEDHKLQRQLKNRHIAMIR